MMQDIRWIQRLSNYDKALIRLQNAELKSHIERRGKVVYSS